MAFRPVPLVAPQKPYRQVGRECPHLIGTAGNELWATGEWSETGQGKTGEPIPIKGYWSHIYIREADDFKIRMAAWNTTPDSILLINKSFASRQAATPSPT